MEFDWDDAKSERTRRDRGFGFDDAIRIFKGSVVEWPDTRREWGEVRTVAIGKLGDQILAAIYTDRGDVRRVISARVARRKERRLWLSSVKR